MTAHDTRLWINRNYHQIKHWLFVIIGFTLIAFALLSYANSNRLLQKVSTLSQQNKVLSEQNKELNQKNQQYAEATQKVVLQNRDYVKCLSTIFANYTHNFVPVTIDNLDSCTIQTDGTFGSSAPKSVSSSVNPTASSMPPASTGSQAPSQESSGSSSSSPNPTPSTPQPQPKNPQPSVIQQVVNDIRKVL